VGLVGLMGLLIAWLNHIDMQFDSAAENGFATTYESIKKKYSDAGYTCPNIIFWNLRGSFMRTLYVCGVFLPRVEIYLFFSSVVVFS
jgi:hypothetical protein